MKGEVVLLMSQDEASVLKEYIGRITIGEISNEDDAAYLADVNKRLRKALENDNGS